MQYVLHALFSFVGIGLSAVVIIVSIFNLVQKKGRLFPLCYLLIAASFATVLAFDLIRQSSGVVCALSRPSTLVVYGLLSLLQVFFLFDGLKQNR